MKTTLLFDDGDAVEMEVAADHPLAGGKRWNAVMIEPAQKPLPVFTVIGVRATDGERYADHISAEDAVSAEKKFVVVHPGVLVAGVLSGEHDCIDYL